MKKREQREKDIWAAIFLAALFILSFWMATVFVSAEDQEEVAIGEGFGEIGFFQTRWEIWKLGASGLEGQVCVAKQSIDHETCTVLAEDSCTNPKCKLRLRRDIVGETVKYFLLILIILLVYSGFSYMDFPENPIIRGIMSAVVGFLATFLIATNELITGLLGYSALGLTGFIILPILALLAITFVVASKSDPVGMFLSRIIWGIYGFALLIKAGILALWLKYFGVVKLESGAYRAFQRTYPANHAKAGTAIPVPPQIHAFLPKKQVVGQTAGSFEKITDLDKLGSILQTADLTTLWILIITAILILIFLAFKGDWIQEWISKTKRDAEIQAEKAKISRSKAYDTVRSEAMQEK